MDVKTKKCLMRWHEYSETVTEAVQSLRYHEELLDVTLACEGKTIRAHKLVLAACSQYFRQVLKEYPCDHPTIILDGISWSDLLGILQFMYCGFILIDEEAVCTLLAAAYTLDVVGLNYVTEALLDDKYICTKKEKKEELCDSKIKCDKEEMKTEIKIVDVPNVLNLSSQAQSQICKDIIIPTSASPVSISNNLSIEPNTSSIGDSDRSNSTGSPFQNFRNHAYEGQPSFKKVKSGSENNPPDVHEVRSPETEEHINGSVFPGLYKHLEDVRRKQNQEKILLERKLNEEHRERNSDSPLMRLHGIYPVVNGGDGALSKSYEDYEDHNSLDNELSQDGLSQDNADSDMGPDPLPYNHPAVLASTKSAYASVSAAAALAAAAANGGSINPMNYAAYLAANSRGMISSSGIGNVSPHHNAPSPSGMGLPTWMPPTNNSSPSSSPPLGGSGGFPPGFIHPPGMSQQDLQATLEQYQRKLAFHEPRPCPTCRRMYRDAATLRTHIAIMHSDGKEPFACSCGSLFRTKYDMYQHKKNGHR